MNPSSTPRRSPRAQQLRERQLNGWHLRLRSSSKPPPTHRLSTTRSSKRKFASSVIDGPADTKRARLTRRNLKRLDKMGRSGSSKTPSNFTSSTTSITTKAVSTTASGFADLAHDNGVLVPAYSVPPANLDDLQERLNKSRETVSPTESEFRWYSRKQRTCPNEDTGSRLAMPLLKTYRDDGYSTIYNKALLSIPQNVGFNDGLSAPKPDFVEGLDLTEFRPVPVRMIKGAVVRPGASATTLPHLTGEWKAPGKDMNLAELQAAYSGAALVYGRDQANEYLGAPDPPAHAVVCSFAMDGKTLNTYAHYSEQASPKAIYHQTEIESTNLLRSFDDYRKGRRQLRNLQDHAREESYRMRDRLVAACAYAAKDNMQHSFDDAEDAPAPATPDEHELGSGNDIQEKETDYDDEPSPSAQLLTEYTEALTRDTSALRSPHMPGSEAVEPVFRPVTPPISSHPTTQSGRQGTNKHHGKNHSKDYRKRHC